VSFADEDSARAGQLIERLLVDPGFRAAFRADPAGMCRELGLEDLATELRPGNAMQTLELRESKSSLAGVVMAVAAEGVGVAELRGLFGRSLHGPAKAAAMKALAAGGVKPPHGAHAAIKPHGALAAIKGPDVKSALPGSAGSAPAAPGAAATGADSAQSGSGSSAAAATSGAGAGASPGGPGAGAASAASGTPAGGPTNPAAAGGSGAVAPSGGAGAAPQPGGSGAVPEPGSARGQQPASRGGLWPDPEIGGRSHQGVAGKISWFGGPHDPGAQGTPASGVPISHPGIAIYNPHTLGGYWLVKMPNGRQAVLQQTDLGPAPSTGRKIDFTYSALPELGYTEHNFPTDSHASATYLGKTLPPGVKEGATTGGPVSSGAGGWPAQSGGPVGSGAPSGSPEAPGAGGVSGSPVGAGVGASDVSVGGGAGGSVAELSSSSRLVLSPTARAMFAQGTVDPRLVSVLSNAVRVHTIVLGGMESVVDPVHAQAVDIVSVDGQPVGPGNVAARDLITEIAAMDPGVRPSEIGTPWPIQSPGFFTDSVHQDRLRLAFVSQADYSLGAVAGGAVGAGAGDGAAVGGASPIAATPAAAGVAEAAGKAVAAENAGPPPQPMAAPAAGQPVGVQEVVAQAPPSRGGGGGGSGYVNPFPKDVQIGRVDMGIDADMRPGDAIVAPGRSRVLGIMPNWYRGQPYIGLQLLDGPMKGRNYYLAEQIDPAVRPGQVIGQGQPIAHYASSGTGIEMGWAGGNWQQTLAQATSGYSEGQVTPAGADFEKFLKSLPPPGSQRPATPPPAASVAAAGQRGITADAAPAGQPAATAPPPPGPQTAMFRAAERHRREFHRNTVKFMAAVKPESEQPAQPEIAQAAQQNQRLAQGPGLMPEGPVGAISVSSHLLTGGQATFAGKLAELTGLNPRVVAAWELAEESGSAAQGREAAHNFNWLNIGYFDSGAGAIAFNKAFGDPVSAAEQTANFLKGKWGGASPGIRAILGTVGKSAREQMMAIANSGWASSHYNNGANLIATFNELADIEIRRG
jgi:hypothetical protein